MKRGDYSGTLFQEGLIAIILIYFCLHGYVAHYGSVPVAELVLLFLVLLSATLLIHKIFTKVLHSRGKATIFTSFLALVILFFGVFQDLISSIKLTATLGRLTIFFPFTMAFTIVIFIFINRAAGSFLRFRQFLTTLVLLYLLLDVFNLTQLSAAKSGDTTIVNKGKSHASYPSVYLILLDEYAGNETLYSYYRYPNATFRQFLKDHRFHVVVNPSSNYNLTIYSMASMFNMNYLPNKGPAIISNHYAYKDALQLLEKNATSDFFRQMGYKVNNRSPFYFDGQAPAYSTGLLPDKMNLLQHQTMYYRVAKAIPDLLAEQLGVRYFAERSARLADESNHRMMTGVLNDLQREHDRPTFTYLHLMMPHEPMVKDSLGNYLGLTNYGAARTAARVDSAYLQYLVYTNNKMTVFVDSLQQQTKGEAVIILMSDHGSRHLARKDARVAYNNLHAVYIPNGDYANYRNGLTNVNAFPLLFNGVFGKNLAVRKDSIVQ